MAYSDQILHPDHKLPELVQVVLVLVGLLECRQEVAVDRYLVEVELWGSSSEVAAHSIVAVLCVDLHGKKQFMTFMR